MTKQLDKKPIAIIGAGLTGLTLGYFLKKKGIPIKIYEKSNHIGGVIKSFNHEGFIYEQGPNSGTLSNIETVQLLEALQADIEVELADELAKKRLIWKNNQWEALPDGLMSAVKTPLFTFKDKLNVLKEPFQAKGNNPNENIADMVRRRLGQSFLDYAVDPFISGIYAGDPEYLVTRFALPKLYDLEQTYGSFIKGAIQKAKEPKTIADKKVTKQIFSIKGGLEELVKALIKHIGEQNILTGQTSLNIQHTEQQFKINNQIYHNVVSTVRADQLAAIFPFIEPNLLNPIQNLKYAPVVEIGLGFRQWKGMDIKAFGGLVPGKEQRNILGLLFMSTIFKNRAPKQGALFTLFIGGAKRPELTQLNQNELLKLIGNDFMDMMAIKEFNPDLIHIKSYSKAIAQYGTDSNKRLESIEQIQKKYPGLILAGNIRDGVGMADRIKQAKNIANDLIHLQDM